MLRSLLLLLDLVSGMLDKCSIASVPEDKESEHEANHCNPRSAGVKDG